MSGYRSEMLPEDGLLLLLVDPTPWSPPHGGQLDQCHCSVYPKISPSLQLREIED